MILLVVTKEPIKAKIQALVVQIPLIYKCRQMQASYLYWAGIFRSSTRRVDICNTTVDYDDMYQRSTILWCTTTVYYFDVLFWHALLLTQTR